MLHRFRKIRNASIENILIDENKSNVETFDEINIIIFEFEDNSWNIIFRNVCYTPNFMTNIVVTGKFRAQRMYFDNQRMRMHANRKTFGWMKHTHDHDVLENNTSIYTFQKKMIVESIETFHPKKKKIKYVYSTKFTFI